MKGKIKKGNLETCVIFLLTPFLSIPLIIIQIKRGDSKLMGLLISCLLGIVSSKYVPSFSNDKARYIERVNELSTFNYSDLLNYLRRVLRPDFIFDHFIFIFSKIGINFNIFFFLCTTFTVYSLFLFNLKVNKSHLSSFQLTVSSALLLIFSFSLPSLFSGVRFTLAASVFIWVIYYFFIKRNIVKGIFLVVLTIFTHFSFAFFIPVILLVFFLPKKINPKYLLLASFVFVILPKEFVRNVFSFLNLPENYSYKINHYLSLYHKLSDNAEILSFLNLLWLYFVSFYLLMLSKEIKNKFYLFIILSMAFVNVTFSMSDVFNRYSLFLKFIITVYFIVLFTNDRIKSKYFYMFFIFSFISFFIGIYVSRDNFVASYINSSLLTLWTIFSNEISQLNFL